MTTGDTAATDAALKEILRSPELLKAAADAMSSTVPNSDGVLWEFEDTDPNTGEPVQPRPVTLTDAARAALTAAAPFLTVWVRQQQAEAHPDILQEIEERRADEAFMERIRSRVAEDADLLQRIGEDELFIADIRARLSQAEAERDRLAEGIKALADEWEPKFPVSGTNIGGQLPAYQRLRALLDADRDGEG